MKEKERVKENVKVHARFTCPKLRSCRLCLSRPLVTSRGGSLLRYADVRSVDDVVGAQRSEPGSAALTEAAAPLISKALPGVNYDTGAGWAGGEPKGRWTHRLILSLWCIPFIAQTPRSLFAIAQDR